jgi:alkenylglycerophosphocholine hydrolase
MMAFWPLLVVSSLFMLLDWLAVWRCWVSVETFAKPGVMIVLMAWFWETTQLAPPAGWFLVGLFFSLAGDILLLPPAVRFMPGLAAFLLGHLAYLTGFNQSLPPFSWGILPIIAVLGAAAAWLYRRVSAALARHNTGPVLLAAVTVYSLALTLMAISASLTLVRPEWGLVPALITTAGALLFFASDSMLALDRFVAPIPNGRVYIHATYHLGQLGLVFGLALHLAK